MDLIRLIDEEIQRLQNARRLLTGGSTPAATKTKGKRVLSASARRKISLAQKARWAKVRKAAKG